MGEHYEETFRTEVGEVIRKLRKEQGLSLRKLGLMVDINYTYLFSIENGTANMSINMLVKIACGLNTTVSEIVSTAEQKILDTDNN